MTTLLLFDVDGTLTQPRKLIDNTMAEVLNKLYLRKDIDIGFVGGSDRKKQIEQIGYENLKLFDWQFSENGLESYHKDELIHKQSFVKKLGEDNYKKLVNISLSVLATLECPVKRGTFIEYRNGMINISPIGRACNQKEREEFNDYDNIHKVRETMNNEIKLRWNNLNTGIELQFSIGGEISVDIFPIGWNKTYCLQFVENKYKEIQFFGDKTDSGGNDYEIYHDNRVIGHKVEKYQDTVEILNSLF
jgi:phosphomannomutase